MFSYKVTQKSNLTVNGNNSKYDVSNLVLMSTCVIIKRITKAIICLKKYQGYVTYP